jgi:hypothetical protein
MTSRPGSPYPCSDYPLPADDFDAAAAAAALPSGLAKELPAEVADATGAPQFSASRTWFVGDALVFSGGASVLLCCLVTMQSDRSTVSPTVVVTTTDSPADDN